MIKNILMFREFLRNFIPRAYIFCDRSHIDLKIFQEVVKMVKDKITVTAEGSQSFDKMQIALAIRNSTYEDNLGCSLLENNVLEGCEGCNLREICMGIEESAESYYESTTEVVEKFSF